MPKTNTFKGPTRQSTDANLKIPAKIRVGICAMEKKVAAKPMQELIKRLEGFGFFEICTFPQQMICEEPVESWPFCDAFIAFFSDGFPLLKAQQYVELHPEIHTINDIKCQSLLMDRRDVYSILTKNGIPVPTHVFCNRNEGSEWPDSQFEEFEDHIVCDGVSPIQLRIASCCLECIKGTEMTTIGQKRINKPFVEKPVSGEDHNVYIYYPRAAGGGTKRLFRKKDNKSSDFFPTENNVRREGSYLYEEFMATEGTDVKVYAVGKKYAHAEARKSPVLDGVVQRSEDGKEIRYPVMLTRKQKKIAHDVVVGFKQGVCGFDLLVSGRNSFVCDVNGWSFVKNSPRFWDDMARTLAHMMIEEHRARRSMTKSRSLDDVTSIIPALPEGSDPAAASVSSSDDADEEELRCVIAVIRHGDRTPKQKMKMKVVRPGLTACFVDLFDQLGNGSSDAQKTERKLKTARDLQTVLDTTRGLISHIAGLPSSTEDGEKHDREEVLMRLEQMRAVLEKGGQFGGINRKVQIKPVAWDVSSETESTKNENGEKQPLVEGKSVTRVKEALLVIKWGGNLTSLGLQQANELGQRFREELYPGEREDFLRLHNSYRHDLKIYSSDEGRVQMTAASFTKSFLSLEGELTPILVSLVSRDRAAHNMLDPSGVNLGKEIQEEVKETLRYILQRDQDITEHDFDSAMLSTMSSTIKNAVKSIGNPTSALRELRVSIARLLTEGHIEQHSRAPSSGSPAVDWATMVELHDGENLRMLEQRWKKLYLDLYNVKKEVFDISKIPDVYDCAKYDAVHNEKLLGFRHLEQLYSIVRRLSEFVCPSEYGLTRKRRLDIGATICRNLLTKIVGDIEGVLPKQAAGMSDDESEGLRLNKDFLIASDLDDCKEIKTRLYFTSESHIHSILNSIRYSHLVEAPAVEADDGADHDEQTEEPAADAAAGMRLDDREISGYVSPLRCSSILNSESASQLNEIPEFDYLSQIVIRVFERKQLDDSNPCKFRVEVGVSPGVAGDPFDPQDSSRDCKPVTWFRTSSECLSARTFLGRLSGVIDHATRLRSKLQDGVGRHTLTTAAVHAADPAA